jgi:hypothetical protein
MKLTGLENIYKGLKKNNENYFIFTFQKRNIIFNVLFDIFKKPFELCFIQKNKRFHFSIKVELGFVIDPRLGSETYKKLCEILNLKYDPNNRFSPFAFFSEFNKMIPKYSKRVKEKRELLDFYIYDIEEPEKLNFGGTIEWKKINNGKHVSKKNLEKTRILFPERYETCKREDISIIYKSDR